MIILSMRITQHPVLTFESKAKVSFTFNGKVDVIDRAPAKDQRMANNIKKVLAMQEPPYINKKRIMKELDLTSSQAYVLLKEMTDTDIIKKYGRGDDAIYKAVVMSINNITE